MTGTPGTSRLAAAACGVLTAVYLLVGRWTLSRLGDAATEHPFYTEVRFWVVLLLVCVSLMAKAQPSAGARGRGGLTVPALFVFFTYWVATAAWAPDPVLAAVKLYEVVLVAAATFGLARALWSDDSGRVLRWMWAGVLAVAGLLATVALVRLVTSGAVGERLSVMGGGPNSFARLMGYLALAALFFWRRHGRSWLFMPIAAISLVLVMLSGSRGGLIALVLGVGVFLVSELRNARRLVPGFVLAAVVFAITATYSPIGAAALETYERRVNQLLLQEQYTSGRTRLYRSAYQLALKEPVFGDGLAAFSGRRLGVYPHNLFLEAFCEAGILGVALLSLTFGAGAVASLRGERRPDGSALAGFAFMLVAAQFSGDLFDSRALFAFLLLSSVQPPAAAPVAAGPPSLRAELASRAGP
ncbi:MULTISPECIES: O-antigen ligase [Anaeromyxobacter]|uniref:O-antigen ligase family protein n=1 Tax=Anaeromyxobacter TaxID=161492 RepID=UPI001F59A7DF|nr:MULTISPECIES: O-antigen ligase family protein [unclassified Anaeromyxobacter]